MSATHEEAIKLQIKETLQSAKRSLTILEQNYEALTRVRKQLPVRFLTKTGIKEHIKKVAKYNDQYLKKIQKKLDLREKELKKVHSQFQSASTDEQKKTLKEKGQMIQKEIGSFKEMIEREESIHFDVNDERVNYFYEDLLLFVANCKHESIDLWRFSAAAHEDVKADFEYFEAQMLLEVSESYLKRKGITRISLDVREAFLKSHEDLKNYRKLVAKFKALRDSTKKLVDGLEASEVNFRKFADRKNIGL